MMQRKICIVGAFAVGKTSLVSRFVEHRFSKQYQTTVGVKISKKSLQFDAQAYQCVLWDLAGEDEFLQVQPSYLRGAAGYILVVDGTRQATLETALSIRQRVIEVVGDLPFVVLVNKSDLENAWDLQQGALTALTQEGWVWVKASAKTGSGVDEAFESLLAQIQGAK